VATCSRSRNAMFTPSTVTSTCPVAFCGMCSGQLRPLNASTTEAMIAIVRLRVFDDTARTPGPNSLASERLAPPSICAFRLAPQLLGT
jgi:hypothetical protein